MCCFFKDKEEISKNVTLPYSILEVPPLCKPMHPRKDLEQSFYKIPNQSCLQSRALTGSERNYQNLERECSSTIWGMEKFHNFLYGKEFTLETDQKPLVSIYRKHIVIYSLCIHKQANNHSISLNTPGHHSISIKNPHFN